MPKTGTLPGFVFLKNTHTRQCIFGVRRAGFEGGGGGGGGAGEGGEGERGVGARVNYCACSDLVAPLVKL